MPAPLRCLVLGGSGTLGRAIVSVLATAGDRVAFTFHTGSALARDLGAEFPETHGIRADLRVLAELDAAVDSAASSLGGLDALVHAAAVAGLPGHGAGPHHETMSDVDAGTWEEVLAVNARSAFFAVRLVAPILAKESGGNIVLVGSIDGIRPVPARVHYAASKGALAAMTHAMAKELGPAGIRVNLVAPGILEEGLSRALPPEIKAEYLKHCGLKRLGRLEEIASVIAWLVRENTYVTGQSLVLDGAL